ncbi:TPM domain-containing protein [Aliiroseovarius sp.]|uniref:TPM domain-containing protein n=1 Tax=Aliiroseovarius sp. TaxID=1872442 RepID=UPI003BA9C3DB
MLRILTFLCFALPGLAAAQSYPEHENIYVNDYAEVLDVSTEADLRAELTKLREATGVEMTVLTLHTRETWVPGSRLEDFATGLFNEWGIGNATRNDGILILVLTHDRDMRIELGSGYGRDFDIAAEYIAGLDMLPHFKQGDYATGIVNGTDRVIEWVVQPHVEGHQPPKEALDRSDSGSGSMTRVILFLFSGFAALIIGGGLFGQRIKDRFATCPQCGQRGMHTRKEVLDRATRQSTGRGERTVTCRHCNYHNATIYTIPVISSSSNSSSGSGGGFGGGSSSGGGASGSW